MASLSSGSGCYLLGGRTDPPSKYCYYCCYYEIKSCFYELCNGSKRGDLSDLSKRHRFVATSSEGDLKRDQQAQKFQRCLQEVVGVRNLTEQSRLRYGASAESDGETRTLILNLVRSEMVKNKRTKSSKSLHILLNENDEILLTKHLPERV